jgi:hypothetical protein
MMGGFLGLVAIVMIFGIPLLAIWTKHQATMQQSRSGFDEAEVQQLVNQVEVLQDRVQVLERIVTDQGFSVASQIEALREPARSGKKLADKRGEEVD